MSSVVAKAILRLENTILLDLKIGPNKMKILLEIIDANFRPRILKITKKKITQINCKKYLIFFI